MYQQEKATFRLTAVQSAIHTNTHPETVLFGHLTVTLLTVLAVAVATTGRSKNLLID